MTSRQRALEWGLLAFGPFACAALAMYLGQNDSWDLRNYHWYNPYALLHGRMGFDVAVAHHATYYNPLLDVPVWLLGNALPGWLASALLGFVHGLNFSLLYLIARDALSPELHRRRAIAAALALTGACGAYAITLTGTTHHDNVVSIAVLLALWWIVRGWTTLDSGAWRDAWRIAAWSGLLVGIAVGLKLPTAPFGLGLLAALAAAPSTNSRRLHLVTVGGAAAFAGLLLASGWWFWRLWQETGNPLFPYFNDVIGSPLILDASYRDARFLPHGFGETLLYPFRAAMDWRVSSDWPVTDWRIAFAYVAVAIGVALSLTGSAAETPLVRSRVTRILFAFFAVAYASWLAVFAIYRYIVPLEMLAPLLIVAGLGMLPLPRTMRAVAVAIALCAAIVLTHIQLPARVPFSPKMIEVHPPAIARPAQSLALMTGVEPMAFVIPAFPPEIAFLRIDGWLVGPQPRTPYFERMARQIAAHRTAGGDLFVLFVEFERDRSDAVLAAIGLHRLDDCAAVRTNLTPALRWCRVAGQPAPTRETILVAAVTRG